MHPPLPARSHRLSRRAKSGASGIRERNESLPLKEQPSDAADGLTRPSWNVVTLKTRCWYTRPLPWCAQPAALDKHPAGSPESTARKPSLAPLRFYLYRTHRRVHTLPGPMHAARNITRSSRGVTPPRADSLARHIKNALKTHLRERLRERLK